MTEDEAKKLTGLRARRNAIEVCGPQTGHNARTIAFCETPEIAAAIVSAVKLAAKVSFGGDGVI